jgi:hypothetical protein
MRYCLLVMSIEVEAGVNRVGHDRSGNIKRLVLFFKRLHLGSGSFIYYA